MVLPLVVPPSVGPSPPKVAVVPISRVLVVLVILVTLLTLVALVATPVSPSNPGTAVTRLTDLKVVSATVSHRARYRAMGIKTRRWLVLDILVAGIRIIENRNLWLSILENNSYPLKKSFTAHLDKLPRDPLRYGFGRFCGCDRVSELKTPAQYAYFANLTHSLVYKIPGIMWSCVRITQ